MGKVNCVWPFLYSGPPTYLHLPELDHKGDRAPPYTAHDHQRTRIPRAFTAFEQKATAPPSAFRAFQPSLRFAAFHLSPEAPGECRPGEKSRMARFSLVSVWPGPFPALHLEHKDNGLGSLSILTFSNSLVAHFLWRALLPTSLWENPRSKDHYSFVFIWWMFT